MSDVFVLSLQFFLLDAMTPSLCRVRGGRSRVARVNQARPLGPSDTVCPLALVWLSTGYAVVGVAFIAAGQRG